ncbi:MAG: ribose-phosphate pyrophosphokinase [Deltaproteobacteria bacterium]|nr:ribose-phosphate pyrophosphokinase [Deltaproteobacteria bacterium]
MSLFEPGSWPIRWGPGWIESSVWTFTIQPWKVFSVPLIHVSAFSILSEQHKNRITEKSVILAPDLGAAKLAQRYGNLLDLPAVDVHKERRSGEHVAVRSIIGKVKGRSPILVDGIISTGGTMVSAIRALLETGALPNVMVVATHGLFAGNSLQHFQELPVKSIIVTESVENASAGHPPAETVSLKTLLSDTIQRYDSPLEKQK